MGKKLAKLLFDKRDHALIRIVNDALSADHRTRFARRVYFPYLHPHGIKEMTETKGLRTAYAVAQLLSSLEVGGVDDRINALRSLRQEVIDTAEGPLAKNTARVLLQIMKDLVRAHGDYPRQLELAHEFRRAASGKPRVVRRQLRNYHLLEMPEEWHQTGHQTVYPAAAPGNQPTFHRRHPGLQFSEALVFLSIPL